jgi:hypothetical protein
LSYEKIGRRRFLTDADEEHSALHGGAPGSTRVMVDGSMSDGLRRDPAYFPYAMARRN